MKVGAKTERSKRHLNMLASIAVCAGLMIAYYLSVGQGRISPDTHITFEHHDCATGCSSWQVDILADGTTWYQARSVAGLNGIFRYKLSKFALRRVLRVFSRARFFDLSPTGYPAGSGPVCTLTLTSDHQKMALRHPCGITSPEIAGPVTAVMLATHASDLAGKAGGRSVGLHPVRADLSPGNIVHPLTSPR